MHALIEREDFGERDRTVRVDELSYLSCWRRGGTRLLLQEWDCCKTVGDCGVELTDVETGLWEN